MNPVWWVSVSCDNKPFVLPRCLNRAMSSHTAVWWVKVMLSPIAKWGSGGIAPLILNLSTGWWWVFVFRFTPGNPPSLTDTDLIGSWVGPRADVGASKKVFIHNDSRKLSVPVAARSKAWVYGRLLAGNVGSNPVGAMGVCLLWML